MWGEMNWTVQISQCVLSHVAEILSFQVTNVICYSKFLPLNTRQKYNVTPRNGLKKNMRTTSHGVSMERRKERLVTVTYLTLCMWTA